MPTVHADTSLETSREQLANARAEIMLGARRLRAEASPSTEDSHLMADAILEYFAAAALVVFKNWDALSPEEQRNALFDATLMNGERTLAVLEWAYAHGYRAPR